MLPAINHALETATFDNLSQLEWLLERREECIGVAIEREMRK
jgi:hypothetical protein